MEVRAPVFRPDLSWNAAVEAFLFSRKVAALSNATIEWYRRCLMQFVSFPNHDCQSPLNCTKEHCQAFILWLQGRGVRSITIHNRFRSLRAFFNWLVKEGLRQDNPAINVTLPKIDQPLPKTVTESHFLAAVSTLNPNRLPSLRNLALFVLAFDTGARIGELLKLKVSDVDLVNKVAVVKGKGSKERIIVFGQKAAQLLKQYLTKRVLKENRPLNPDDYLFVFSNGNPLEHRYVLRAWHSAQRKAGLNPLPFHGLRHGFARVWLLRGGDGLSLQILLGHSTPIMTRRYITLWGTDLKQIHAKVSPVDGLKLRLR